VKKGKVLMYENRTIKAAEIVLRRGEEGETLGMHLIRIYCKYLCKNHNVPPIQPEYVNNLKERMEK
jgi:hypothetical protein